MTGLACALAGCDVLLAFGILDSAQTASLAKTVLDADTVGAIERFLREDPVDETHGAASTTSPRWASAATTWRRKSTRQFYRAGELWQPAALAAAAVRGVRRAGRWWRRRRRAPRS